MRLWRWLAAVFASVFGRFSWSPPPWVSWLGRPVAAVPRGVAWLGKRLQEPRFAAVVGGAVLVVVGGLAAWYFWPRAAEPIELSLSISPPSPPPPRTARDPEPSPAPLSVSFSGSAAPLERIGKPLDARGGVTLEPSLPGEWRWQSDSLLVFSPREPWPIGQQYEIRFADAAIADHVRLSQDSVSFTTQAFSATLAEAEFYQDPVDPAQKQVVATVRFNYPVEPQSFESRLSMRLVDPQSRKEQPYRFTVTYDDLRFLAYVRSGTVAIPLEDQNMRLTLAEGVQAQAGGPATQGEQVREVRVPGRFNLFKIQSAHVTLVRNEQYDPEQVLVVECTSGVHEAELAKAVSAFVLPVDKPALQGKPAQKNYPWSSSAEIGPEILKLAKSVTLTPIPAEHEISTVHTFKLDVPPSRHLYVRIKKGVEAHGGYILAKEFDSIAWAPEFPREVRIMHEGAVLAVGGEQKLSVMARGIPAVRLELARVLPGDLNHLLSQSTGDFKNPYFQNYLFNEQNVAEIFAEVRKLDASDPRRAQYTAVDFGKYLDAGDGQNRGLFILGVRAWDPEKNEPAKLEATTTYQVFKPRPGDGGSEEDYEGEGEGEGEGYDEHGEHGDEGGYAGQSYDQAQDRRFVLLTDLGVLIKTDVEQTQAVFVQSIGSGEPVTEATVEVLGKNGVPVLSRRTDESGVARFPTLKDFAREKQPVAYVVKKGADLSFLPIGRGDRLLNASRFDVGGSRTHGQADALAAFLFSDRGIYRPGDTFHVGMLVKPVDWTRSVQGVPVQVVVSDARGLEVKKQRLDLPESGFVEIDYTTEETAPTGTYSISAYIVQDQRRQALLGSTTVRVEEFLPDRLRITARIVDAPSEGWIAPEALQARVELSNLFGTPAAQHRVAASMTLQPRFPSFARYREFSFYDPLRADRSYEERLEDTDTDDQGVASFSLDLQNVAPATYQLSFYSQGYELDGGRGVSAEASALVSPLPYLVGYKADGDLSYLKKGAARGVTLIAVDPKLARIKVDKLKAVLIEQRWVSVLMRQPNGNYQYQSVEKELTRGEKPLAIGAGGTAYELPTGEPGTFVVSIRDAKDTELNRISFHVVGEANLSRQLERNAELEVVLDRRDYAPGDTVEVQITAPYAGAGLITIERDKVYSHKWFKTETTSTVQTMTLPGGLEGNGYVSVAFVRSLASPEVFMSPLSYGVVPFSVDRRQRTVAIGLEGKELVRPGDTLEVTYTTDRPTKLVLYGVDEGILQVAGYKTPDPLGYFLSKRALEVATWQILDLILPEYSVALAASRPGGDEELSALAKNLNPFKRKRDKPVVFWSGIIDAGPEPRKYRYQVPDYFNGSLRVMAVAVSADAMGAAARKTVVRGPFVLSPNTPLFVGPGDSFEASVAVANNIEGSGKDAKVEVTLATTGGLEIVGGASRTVSITEGHEAATRFTVRAKPELGNADLRFTAKAGKEQVSFTATTSVRPPTPYIATVKSGSVKDGKAEVPVTRAVYERLSRFEVGVSPLPLALARGLAVYLENYPYLCTEQLVSGVVPALVLSSHPGFGYDAKRARAAAARVFGVLQSRQNAEGAFGFWAANSHVSDYQAIYVTHVLIEARERGYVVPGEVEARATRYVKEVVRRPLSGPSAARLRAYGIYVLARSGQLATAELAELSAYVRKEYPDVWKRDIAAVYMAGAYQLMRDADEAKKLIKGAEIAAEVAQDDATFYDMQAYLAQFLYILARHFPERLRDVEAPLLERLTAGIAEQRYNTLSSALSILALDAYAKAAKGGDRGLFSQVKLYEVRDKGETAPLSLPADGLFPVVSFSPKATAIRIENQAELPLFYSVTAAGFDTQPPAAALKQGLELIHSYEDDGGSPVTQVALGDTVNVRLKARALERAAVANVAIVDLLPAGFDLVLDTSAEAGLVGRLAAAGSTLQPGYADAREDRVVLYATLGTGVSDFVYKIKAVSRGEFKVPPSFAEAMYDRSLQGRSLGATLSVIGDE